MSKGYVYVLTNEHMPGLVKIGMTTRSVEQRAEELYQTGVPDRFQVYEAFACPDCRALEEEVHAQFSEFRVSDAREFFRMSGKDAVEKIEVMHFRQVQEHLQEFLPDHEIVSSDVCVSASHVMMRAYELGEPDPIIADALMIVPAEDLRPYVNRVYELLEERKKRLEGQKDV